MTLPIIPTNPLDQAAQRSKEAWNQLYKEAIADFPLHEDMNRFFTDLTDWMEILNKKIEELTKIIAAHQHVVPTLDGPAYSTPPLTAGGMVWTGKQYILPQFINTSGKLPNIKGTPGYQQRYTIQIMPNISAFSSPTSLTTGL